MKKCIHIIIVFVLLLMGCAPSFLMKKDEISEIGSGEGLVIGSVLMKVEYDPEENITIFSKSLSNTKWWITIKNQKDLDAIISNSLGYGISLDAEGNEIPFVAKLPAGRYYFVEMCENGFGAFLKCDLNVAFDVMEGKKTYIGRLVLNLPKTTSGSTYNMHFERNISIRIEDAQKETISNLKDEYTIRETDVSTLLMGERKRWSGGLTARTLSKKQLIEIKKMIYFNGYQKISADDYPYEGAYVTQYLKEINTSDKLYEKQVLIFLSFKAYDLSTGPYGNFHISVKSIGKEDSKQINTEIRKMENEIKKIIYQF